MSDERGEPSCAERALDPLRAERTDRLAKDILGDGRRVRI